MYIIISKNKKIWKLKRLRNKLVSGILFGNLILIKLILIIVLNSITIH